VEPIIGTTALGNDKGTWNASEYRYVKAAPNPSVELVVERVDWEPPAPRYSPGQLVPLRIDGYELELAKKQK